MSFKSLPVDQRPYKRFANLVQSDSVVFDPPTDAILLPIIFGTGTIQVYLVGSDDALVSFQFGAAQSGTIIPLSTKKFTTDNASSIVGLWRD